MQRFTDKTVRDFEIKHNETLRKIAPECTVLLKKNGDFPLEQPCRLALYGSGARQTIKGGTGSGDVNVRHFTTCEEGLEKAGFTIVSKDWMDRYDACRADNTVQFYRQIREEAEKKKIPVIAAALGKTPDEPEYDFPVDSDADVCVYVLARNSGEGSDRQIKKGDYLLTDDEIRDIHRCAGKYAKFLLVLNTGGPVDLSPVLDRVENILLLGQLGTVTGDVLADIILGRSYPSGKLTATWAKAEDCDVIQNYDLNDTCYKEGIFVGYRYYDTADHKPLFPFGYGISFTEFTREFSHADLKDNELSVAVKVTNTGRYPGKETVLLYYRAPEGTLSKPIKELGTCGKTRELQPGESEEITLTLPLENMASYSEEQSAWILEKGDYLIMADTMNICAVRLNETVAVLESTDLHINTGFEDRSVLLPAADTEGLKIFEADVQGLRGIGHFDRNRVSYPEKEQIDLCGFTDDELIHTCVGRYDENSSTSIIGNAGNAVAGAAAESPDFFSGKGFGKLILADGPAGLRLATSYILRDGAAFGNEFAAMESIVQFLDEPLRSAVQAKIDTIRKISESEKKYYQFTTAIPIGTALAQSFNPEVPEICGDIVGEEMGIYGINIWLAPALNIQRMPLCGRNFEYCSEDPVVSGLTAAAIVRGVQKHEKCSVTIKHFACNNQEYNRFGSNSVISERTMREIYLKGFELCIKQSAPKCIMSSYNLLNGVHTANHYDLLTTVLRKEWDFGGVVMTDWGTTSDRLNLGTYGASDAALCIKNGNDWIMPGSQPDCDRIAEALENKEISREDLETCAARILALCRELS
ncbi:MAG: glycoside hydrolase family 3 N-terminal domain-containing protein [Erysipelotrichaceae bacterium]|nr:glycoside hydrolase family 3 N-terminal domain-containing protein [Erysipelotrichaceae bacterium]